MAALRLVPQGGAKSAGTGTPSYIPIKPNNQPTYIGRSSPRLDPTGIIKDASISREHCVIQQAPDGRSFLLKDLASTNGVARNWIRIQPNVQVSCQIGDYITISPSSVAPGNYIDRKSSPYTYVIVSACHPNQPPLIEPLDSSPSISPTDTHANDAADNQIQVLDLSLPAESVAPRIVAKTLRVRKKTPVGHPYARSLDHNSTLKIRYVRRSSTTTNAYIGENLEGNAAPADSVIPPSVPPPSTVPDDGTENPKLTRRRPLSSLHLLPKSASSADEHQPQNSSPTRASNATSSSNNETMRDRATRVEFELGPVVYNVDDNESEDLPNSATKSTSAHIAEAAVRTNRLDTSIVYDVDEASVEEGVITPHEIVEKCHPILAISPNKGEALVTAKLDGLSAAQEELTCSVCFEFLVGAMVISCGHSFCYVCIMDWMKNQRTCPQCRSGIQGNPIPNLMLRKIVDTIINEFASDGDQDDLKRRQGEFQGRLVIDRKNIAALKLHSPTLLRGAGGRILTPTGRVVVPNGRQASPARPLPSPSQAEGWRFDLAHPDMSLHIQEQLRRGQMLLQALGGPGNRPGMNNYNDANSYYARPNAAMPIPPSAPLVNGNSNDQLRLGIAMATQRAPVLAPHHPEFKDSARKLDSFHQQPVQACTHLLYILVIQVFKFKIGLWLDPPETSLTYDVVPHVDMALMWMFSNLDDRFPDPTIRLPTTSFVSLRPPKVGLMQELPRREIFHYYLEDI
ncbi:hypothetical protein SeMB42_g07861 [Synchytrium endobioticum]|nr:hypothetical protein SeMB42_g07861 [Synchytrium endobioticum]